MASESTTQVPTAQLFSLQGKTVIATGGTGGLGLAMLTALAESGADIVSICLQDDPGQAVLEQKITALGRKFSGFVADVGDSKSLRECFGMIWNNDIAPDVLLNCAGLNRRGKIEEMSDEDIDLIFSVNLKGSYVAAQEFGMRLLTLQRPGKIINIGSFTSFVAMTEVSAYSATKGGVVQMTKAFSNEWAQHGIQVNAICPGYFKTPLAKALTDKYPEMEKYIVDRTPAGRWGQPSDLRGTVVFLASAASDFVTGQSIVVDGGMQFR